MQMAGVVVCGLCGVCGICNPSQINRRRARSKCLKNLPDSTFLDFQLSFQNLLYRDVTSTHRDLWTILLRAILANFSLCCGGGCCCCCAAICWNLTAMKRTEWTGFRRGLSHSTMLYHYQTDIANDSCRATNSGEICLTFSHLVYIA